MHGERIVECTKLYHAGRRGRGSSDRARRDCMRAVYSHGDRQVPVPNHGPASKGEGSLFVAAAHN